MSDKTFANETDSIGHGSKLRREQGGLLSGVCGFREEGGGDSRQFEVTHFILAQGR